MAPPQARCTAPGPFTELRAWLRHLAASGRLRATRPGLALRYELAAVAKRLQAESAVLFPEPDGHPVPVVSNLLAGRAWAAEAMGVPETDVSERYQAAAESPLPWTEVQDAPVQEVVHRAVDIGRLLPVPTHNEHDSGPYITAGLLISRNPKTGVQNVSINRCQISAPDRLGVLILPRHTFAFAEMAESENQPLEVAIVIGVDPLTLLASQAITPIDHDELEIAGSLHGAPLEVVKCVSGELRVPARAEIILEGRLLPHVREPEGPFGEFPQYYGPRSDQRVIRVDAITQRRKPIYHTILGGGLEHLLLGGIPREATLLAYLRRSFPDVLDVHLSFGGVCRYHLFVRIDKHQEAQARNVILCAFAAHYDVKQVIVVDRDVDVHDPDQVQWAVATRFQANRDLLVVPEAQGSKLDPSARDGVSAKMGLDATVPAGADPFTFTRIRVPGEEQVDLDQVLARDPGAEIRRCIE